MWRRDWLLGIAAGAGVLRASSRGFRMDVPGAGLYVMDWGGAGAGAGTFVMLAGLGDTPFIYDGIAGRLAKYGRVIGITRRGFGRSDQPESGYELDALVSDVAAVMDSLELRKATLVGHSFGGVEMLRFAEQHPERVSRMIFFDTAYVPMPVSFAPLEGVYMDALAGMSSATRCGVGTRGGITRSASGTTPGMTPRK